MNDPRHRCLSHARLGRRQFLGVAAGYGAAALAAACQAPAPAAGSSPAPSSTAAGTPAGWEQQWGALVAAARQEGRVVFSGPPTPEVRTKVVARFKERFGVDVEYVAGRRGELLTRWRAERSAGVYTVDVIVGGAQTIATELYPEKLIDPLRPLLIHPDVTDPAKWKLGKIWFIDPDDTYALRLVNSVTPALGVNTTRIQADEIKTAQDLLNPRYRGLIAQDDPTVSGSGSNTAAYLQRMLGEDFITRLYRDQRVEFTRDRRQLSDWLGRGTYPIVINPNDADVLGPLYDDGFPVAAIPSLPDLQASVTAGSGMMVLVNRAPNPNAAQLLVNWLASREGMELYAHAEKGVPLRNDVDQSWAHDYLIPKPGVTYFDTYDWDFTLSDKTTVSERIKAMRAP
jgi:iron(III) transport system substrate-binding protein